MPPVGKAIARRQIHFADVARSEILEIARVRHFPSRCFGPVQDLHNGVGAQLARLERIHDSPHGATRLRALDSNRPAVDEDDDDVLLHGRDSGEELLLLPWAKNHFLQAALLHMENP